MRSATSIAAATAAAAWFGPLIPAEEEGDDLVADDLVDETVVTDDRLRGQPVEALEEMWNSVGRIFRLAPSSRGRPRRAV